MNNKDTIEFKKNLLELINKCKKENNMGIVK